MLGLDRFKSMKSGLMTSNGYPIAIDFGTAALKVLQIGAGDLPILLAAACLPTPEALLGDAVKRLAFQIEQLPTLIRKAGFKGKRAVCSMPAGQTFCKHLQITHTDGISTIDLVKMSVAQQLGCNADALVCRMLEVGAAGAPGQMEVIGLAASRATVARLMDAIRSCKLEPVGMHPECAAVVKCFDHITKRVGDEHLVTLYLDIGLGCTRVIIANGVRPVFAKTILLGGRFLDQTIAKQAKVDLAEARKIRLGLLNLCAPQPGKGGPTPVISEDAPAPDGGMAVLNAAMAAHARQIAPIEKATEIAKVLSPEIDRRSGPEQPPMAGDAAGLALPSNRRTPVKQGYAAYDLSQYPPPPEGVCLREALDILTDEVRMCLRYHEGLFPGKRTGRIIFVGGEARHTALCQHIAKALKAPAHVADPLARLGRDGHEQLTGVEFSQTQPGWAVPVGLCLLPTDL